MALHKGDVFISSQFLVDLSLDPGHDSVLSGHRSGHIERDTLGIDSAHAKLGRSISY